MTSPPVVDRPLLGPEVAKRSWSSSLAPPGQRRIGGVADKDVPEATGSVASFDRGRGNSTERSRFR